MDVGHRNDKVLREFDPPLAVEHLVYEVDKEVFETWKAAEFEFWTKGEADRFPFYRGKETWLLELADVYRVAIIIYWDSVEQWHSIDAGWLEEQERRFAEAVGPGTYRLVHAGHEIEQFHKISEYR